MNKKRILIILAVIILAGIFIRSGLPLAIKKMGLHPEYNGQRYLLPNGRALIITTSHDRLGEKGDETGVFGSEFTAPYYEFLDARMSVDLASIKGGKIPIDPISFKRFVKSEYDDRFLSDPKLQDKVQNSLPIDQVDFTKYDIIFLAGGWGAAYDLGYSQTLGQKITQASKAGKVIGGVCHGLLGLLLAYDENDQPLLKGLRITGVTNKQIEELGISITPQHPERELKAAGAKFESATAFRDIFANHVVIDRRIVSGQNQNAGAEVANRMIKLSGGNRR
ncbi:MAG: type 1 glutamine amidotransferase domain-containing protein [Leptospiraceae bacterium]|nr:type 1 glutamine amidotransferase domain-containing protein [Leptospiraceae bacterium]